MKQKLAALVHKYDRSLLLLKTQSDLSTLLGVSLSTIKRNYNEVGIYDTALYTVYIGVEFYDNGVEPKYRHDVEPPKPKLYNDSKRANDNHVLVQKSYSNLYMVQHLHVEPIEDEPIEKEWFDIEKELLFSELRSYYIRRTEEQLRKSYDYFIERPGNTQRISIINECAKIKQLE